MHLHPRNAGLEQFLQMLTKMVSDLGFDSPHTNSSPASAADSKHTYLGCFYLASA
jgi:hypothetical protein